MRCVIGICSRAMTTSRVIMHGRVCVAILATLYPCIRLMLSRPMPTFQHIAFHRTVATVLFVLDPEVHSQQPIRRISWPLPIPMHYVHGRHTLTNMSSPTTHLAVHAHWPSTTTTTGHILNTVLHLPHLHFPWTHQVPGPVDLCGSVRLIT